MIALSETADRTEIVIGVDTHKDCHVAVALSPLGVVLDSRTFPVTVAGYQDLLTWSRNLGRVTRAGVEGAGSYGVGLTRALRTAGVHVIEVNRPNRAMRRRRGKSDAVDAEACCPRSAQRRGHGGAQERRWAHRGDPGSEDRQGLCG